MSPQRQRYLLEQAALTLKDGGDPFHDDWLTKHDVSYDECISLGMGIGIVLEAFIAATADRYRTEVSPE